MGKVYNISLWVIAVLKNPRFVTLYGHLSQFASGIRKGATVKQSQVIGYVGATGLATGPHLHYAFYENGRPINPLRIKNVSADPISSENRVKFEQIKAEMLQQLKAINGTELHVFSNAYPLQINQ